MDIVRSKNSPIIFEDTMRIPMRICLRDILSHLAFTGISPGRKILLSFLRIFYENTYEDMSQRYSLSSSIYGDIVLTENFAITLGDILYEYIWGYVLDKKYILSHLVFVGISSGHICHVWKLWSIWPNLGRSYYFHFTGYLIRVSIRIGPGKR